MPDIDMDFDSRFRDEMIRYAAERYGRDRVAQIVTFSTIKARAAVRDAARVLGMPYAVGDKVAKAMPPLVMGRDTPLYACLEKHEKYEDGYKMAGELRDMYATDPEAKEVITVAKGLEGLRRQDGIHAAAVVITKDPLTDYLPIQRKPESGQDPEDAPVVTQYEMHGVEELGLLKMDFLGLRNLDVITDTVELIRSTGGHRGRHRPRRPHRRRRRTSSCAGATRSACSSWRAGRCAPSSGRWRRPSSRTSPRWSPCTGRGRWRPTCTTTTPTGRTVGRPVEYLHPDAEEVLGDTYALMVYQESMMRVAQRFAGYSLAEADNLRKACLPAGSRMLTRTRGYVPIEAIMSLRDRRVQTIDERTAVSRFEVVDDVWSVGVKPVFRLTTASGHTIEATSNHPLLVGDRWTELGQIAPGDLVAVASRTRTHGGIQDHRLRDRPRCTADLRGLHSGPRCWRRSAVLLQYRSGADRHVPSRLPGPIRCRVGDGPHGRRGRGHAHPAPTGRGQRAPIHSRHVGALGRQVHPRCVVNAPSNKVARFVARYFCADGWAEGRGLAFGSKSRPVCDQLKRMLLRFGVVSTLSSRRSRATGAIGR